MELGTKLVHLSDLLSNGQAERYVATLKQSLRAMHKYEALALQQCLSGDSEETYHQSMDRSVFTPASRLQRRMAKGTSLYGMPHPANMWVKNQRCL
ncbi:hypothetical protein TNCV_5139181 [Trichonephila clavipes]|nr:hypothetical protein TNCV_5139181 [Trichonephila clavipes]